MLGTERHEARRIDNQLRGRCARQGDPGSSTFYISLEDELMRLFGSERISGIMEKLGMKDGEVIESSIVTRQIEGAQRRVEGMNFDIRKQLLDYDNVMNKQRQAVYQLRNSILDGGEISERVSQMLEESLDESLAQWLPENQHVQIWDLDSLQAYLGKTFGIQLKYSRDELSKIGRDALKAELLEQIRAVYDERVKHFAEQEIDFKEIERMLMLQLIDQVWKNHLYDLDHLKKGIGLRAYGQKDPLIEYQKESFNLYQIMLTRVREQMTEYVFRIQLPPKRRLPPAGLKQQEAGKPQAKKEEPAQKPAHAANKIGRNDPCPCGSGKKYKKCHGQ